MFELSVSVLSQSDLQRIHSAALEILRDVGVRVDHVRVCKALSEMGCLVEDAVVKFPERVVEEVVSKMRDPENMIDGYVGTLPLNRKRFPKDAKVVPVASGQATLAYDLVTDELRPATRQDLADACRLTNTLPGAITGHPVFIPQDAPEVLRDLAALQTSARFYPYSDFVEAYSPEIVPYFLEMEGDL